MLEEEAEIDIRSLAQSVIIQAYEDLTSRMSGHSGSDATDQDIKDALRFLTSMDEQHLEARETWCALAGDGYCPHQLRRNVLKSIAEGESLPLFTNTGA